MSKKIEYISQRLSLRKPQKDSLTILKDLFDTIHPQKGSDLNTSLQSILESDKYDKFTEFERNFPSFTFALATGVGKTRLMGAFVSWLCSEKHITDFLVIAPNLTIYNKLIEDFSNPNCGKYVFPGLADFSHTPPIVITGENYAHVNTQRDLRQNKNVTPLFGEDVFINIFNISKLNAETKGGKLPRIKRLREELGESYFEYLRNLKNLVILMDESHHYRANRGLDVINELDPILGLELTATPKISKGSKSVDFKNVVYEYPLANAINDGLVKIPAVATRSNTDSSKFKSMNDDELDLMKINDAIIVHQKTKVELEIYARNNNLDPVKPFVLVVCQDTTHAEKIQGIIQGKAFFSGEYADKVITVHSQLKGEEKDNNIEELLSVEDRSNKIEIVIHVNMLKEGWDVTNLYTIVPLRKFGAQVLTEQTLGRGLRLPYGERTGNEFVDQLTVIAHENFQKLIEESKKPRSIMLKQFYIDSDNSGPGERVITVQSKVDAELNREEENAKQIDDEQKRRHAELKIKLKRGYKSLINEGKVSTSSLQALVEGSNSQVLRINTSEKERDGISDEEYAEIASEAQLEIAKTIVKNTIQIPRIIVQPSETTLAGFKEFKLDVAGIPKFKPASQDILIRTLDKNQKTTMIGAAARQIASNDSIQDRIVSRLIDYDEIDYERDGELLFKLADEYVDFLNSYLPDDDDKENVILLNIDHISKTIYEQLSKNFFLDEKEFEKVEVKDFVKIEPHHYSSDQPPKNINEHIKNSSELKKTLFCGFEKGCHELYKFDSKAEKVFAEVLETDKSVIKWLRPSLKQFNIYWKHNSRRYEPDFIVETETKFLMVEIKRKSEMEDEDVLEKAKAASEYCNSASKFTNQTKGKPWVYLLIPDSEINVSNDVSFLLAFEKSYK